MIKKATKAGRSLKRGKRSQGQQGASGRKAKASETKVSAGKLAKSKKGSKKKEEDLMSDFCQHGLPLDVRFRQPAVCSTAPPPLPKPDTGCRRGPTLARNLCVIVGGPDIFVFSLLARVTQPSNHKRAPAGLSPSVHRGE